MSSERKKLRVLVLAEDKRTERFFRELLRVLGFEARRVRFQTAPKGKGAGETWVARRYPDEVRELRRKKHQQALRLVTVRDGDKVGVKSRKEQLDQALQSAGLLVRQPDERIATPVPTRNIESWLLALLGAAEIDETADYKPRFKKEHGAHESSALREGTAAWKSINNTSLPSLRDGKAEMQRLDP